MRPHRRLPR